MLTTHHTKSIRVRHWVILCLGCCLLGWGVYRHSEKVALPVNMLWQKNGEALSLIVSKNQVYDLPLREGDRIIALGNANLTSPEVLRSTLHATAYGETVTVLLERDSLRRVYAYAIGERSVVTVDTVKETVFLSLTVPVIREESTLSLIWRFITAAIPLGYVFWLMRSRFGIMTIQHSAHTSAVTPKSHGDSEMDFYLPLAVVLALCPLYGSFPTPFPEARLGEALLKGVVVLFGGFAVAFLGSSSLKESLYRPISVGLLAVVGAGALEAIASASRSWWDESMAGVSLGVTVASGLYVGLALYRGSQQVITETLTNKRRGRIEEEDRFNQKAALMLSAGCVLPIGFVITHLIPLLFETSTFLPFSVIWENFWKSPFTMCLMVVTQMILFIALLRYTFSPQPSLLTYSAISNNLRWILSLALSALATGSVWLMIKGIRVTLLPVQETIFFSLIFSLFTLLLVGLTPLFTLLEKRLRERLFQTTEARLTALEELEKRVAQAVDLPQLAAICREGVMKGIRIRAVWVGRQCQGSDVYRQSNANGERQTVITFEALNRGKDGGFGRVGTNDHVRRFRLKHPLSSKPNTDTLMIFYRPSLWAFSEQVTSAESEISTARPWHLLPLPDLAAARHGISAILSFIPVGMSEQMAERVIFIISEKDGNGLFTEEDITFLLTVISLYRQTAARITAQEDALIRQADLEREKSINRERTAFVAGVSHDLRTPLASIRLFSELLQQPQHQDTRLDYLKIIEGESMRMSRLIGTLLNFTRLNSESQDNLFHFERLALQDIAIGVIKDLTYVLDLNSITLNQHLSTDPLWITADRVLLAQAIENLLLNAVKYSGESKVIDIIISQDDSVGCVSVRDYGIGISKADQEKIFTPFYRTESAKASAQGGFGIGLSFAAAVAQGHHGRLGVESDLGKGSLFTLRVPLNYPP